MIVFKKSPATCGTIVNYKPKHCIELKSLWFIIQEIVHCYKIFITAC